MALTTITTAGITAAAVTEPKLAVSGTGSSSNFLRGDMSWATVAGDIEGVTAGTGPGFNIISLAAKAVGFVYSYLTLNTPVVAS